VCLAHSARRKRSGRSSLQVLDVSERRLKELGLVGLAEPHAAAPPAAQRRLAGRADTGSASGLQQVLQETSLALLRHPDLWVYAAAEVGQVPFAAAESTFNRLAMTERSKLRSELTSNVAGRISQAAEGSVGDSDATSDYIAVTLLVASRGRVPLKPVSGSEELREALRVLGSVPSDQLLALEVIWQPEGAGEVLSADELITAYPNLSHL